MNRVLVPVVAISIVSATVAPALMASAATKQKTPTCSSVSAKVIRQSLGGLPTKPKMQTSANVLICHYTTVDLTYLLQQNKTVFKADRKSNKGTTITGIGQGAYSYGTRGSSLVSLQVLDGSVAFIVSGSTAGLKKIEQLAEKMVPLV